MSIFTDEKNKKEFVRIFRQLTASGALDSDKAITKIMRDYPHFFNQPTEADIVNLSRSEMNSEIRQRALQPNKRSIDIFRRPTDENPR